MTEAIVVAPQILEIEIVPRDEIQSLTFDMKKVLWAESRADEIATVNPHKAPELLACFNKGYLDASNLFAKLKLEQARAENDLAQIKADILLERAPAIIKEKKLSSSADIRQSIIDSDAEYQAAKERLDMINATIEYAKGKMKFLENAYTSVKKIMDTGSWNHGLTANRTATGGKVNPGVPLGMAGRFGTPQGE